MSLKICTVSGMIFALLVWARVFGMETKRAILEDPNGERAAIELQIDMLTADNDTIQIAILDTLKGE